jgi:hypothetical protein
LLASDSENVHVQREGGVSRLQAGCVNAAPRHPTTLCLRVTLEVASPCRDGHATFEYAYATDPNLPPPTQNQPSLLTPRFPYSSPAHCFSEPGLCWRSQRHRVNHKLDLLRGSCGPSRVTLRLQGGRGHRGPTSLPDDPHAGERTGPRRTTRLAAPALTPQCQGLPQTRSRLFVFR